MLGLIDDRHTSFYEIAPLILPGNRYFLNRTNEIEGCMTDINDECLLLSVGFVEEKDLDVGVVSPVRTRGDVTKLLFSLDSSN